MKVKKWKEIELTYYEKGTFQASEEECYEAGFERDKDYHVIEYDAWFKLNHQSFMDAVEMGKLLLENKALQEQLTKTVQIDTYNRLAVLNTKSSERHCIQLGELTKQCEKLTATLRKQKESWSKMGCGCEPGGPMDPEFICGFCAEINLIEDVLDEG